MSINSHRRKRRKQRKLTVRSRNSRAASAARCSPRSRFDGATTPGSTHALVAQVRQVRADVCVDAEQAYPHAQSASEQALCVRTLSTEVQISQRVAHTHTVHWAKSEKVLLCQVSTGDTRPCDNAKCGKLFKNNCRCQFTSSAFTDRRQCRDLITRSLKITVTCCAQREKLGYYNICD